MMSEGFGSLRSHRGCTNTFGERGDLFDFFMKRVTTK